jgi:Sulfotransferase family
LSAAKGDDAGVPTIQPVFLLSISRSGSTLVQRILAAHDGVATAAEPWLLLPQAYARRETGVDAEYMQPLLAAAIDDFAAALPEGEADYDAEVREMALRLYRRAAGPDATHFVDKSPPYCLVPAQIAALFPEAKLVFLWRSPPSVMASMASTWGPWRPNLMTADLFLGLPRLIAAYEANRERSYSVRFEELARGDEAGWRGLLGYLGVDFDPAALTGFADVELGGRMGDPTGRFRYQSLSAAPAEKWKKELSNPLRREWCRRYLRFLGAERLATIGYDLPTLLAELDALPAGFDGMAGDSWRTVKALAKEPVRVRGRNRRLGMPNVIRTLLAA